MTCNPRMHTGIHLIPVCGDSLDPRMHTGIDLDPRMYTGISCHAICFGRGVCMLCIRKILIHRATHVKILIQRVTQGKIADTSETDPRTHTGSPHSEHVGIQKNSHMGSPVRIMKLCAYHIHLNRSPWHAGLHNRFSMSPFLISHFPAA